MTTLPLRIRGGTVVTMNSERAVLEGDVIVRNGRIEAVETSPETRSIETEEIIDAGGCAVIPGLVQCHVHLCQALLRGMADDLPLLDWLRRRIWPLEAAHDETSLRASARLGLAEMLLSGTTSILDMGTVNYQDVIFEAIHESGIRALSGKAMMDVPTGQPPNLCESTRQSMLDSESLYDRWNGAANGRIGYAFAPRFILSCSEALLRETARLADTKKAIVHSHVAEHEDERRAVYETLGRHDLEAFAEFGMSGRRTVLAHGVQLSNREIRAAARAGTRIVHCPSANLKLGSGIAKVEAMRRAGVVVGIGADGAPCNNRMDPWVEVRQAALLAKGIARDATAMTAMEALALATIDGARVLGLESTIGSIETGKVADIVVVNLETLRSTPRQDAAATLVYSAGASDVRDVIVGGEIVVRHGVLQTLNVDEVKDDARREAARVWARAAVE